MAVRRCDLCNQLLGVGGHETRYMVVMKAENGRRVKDGVPNFEEIMTAYTCKPCAAKLQNLLVRYRDSTRKGYKKVIE